MASGVAVRGLFDSSADALAFTTLQGAFLEDNRTFWALIGHTREEILDMTYQSLTPADYRARNAEVVDLVRGSHGKPVGIDSIVKASAKNIGPL